ncbi:MAG: adenylate/guanylate cyclase domain-containing protein [Hyphomicrobiaceae bacterium]|nr:adenylate/guanylate cyclase domain-containing protein [Hyphomicrobiaceae bacterium]
MKCDAPLLAGSRYCAQCGTAVAEEPPTGGLSILRSPVPPHMAELIRRQGNRMIGDRRRVTVLFADIKGSTERISTLDPEEAMAAIAPVIKILMDAVHAHNGLVNRARGDGIMALFGVPLVNEGHALDACTAALAMRDAVAAAEGSPGTALRIGLNSGEVVIQSIGSDLTMNYDASGLTANIAARLEHVAEPGTILISETTRALVKGQMQTEAKGPLALRGVALPVPAYELVAAAPVSRWQARKSLGLSAFTGRSKHLATLDASLPAVERGIGRIVTVTALPGLGKSRLVHELLVGLPAGWLVMQAACSPHRTTSSYHPIAQLMRDLIGLAPGDGDETIETRARSYIRQHDAGLEPLIPAYLSLLDVRTADKAWARLDPVERRLKVMEAVLAALASHAVTRPLLLVIEDVHWCDPETRFIIEALAPRVAGMRMLLLVTQRPEAALRLAETPGTIHIGLEPLETEAAEALARSLLGDDISLVPLKQRILQLADGNPLFIEELVQDLKDRGHLAGSSGDYRLAGKVDTQRLPDSIQAVIAARIDQLDGLRKSVLLTAAVIGRDVPVPLLAHMLGKEAHGLAPTLAQLQAADLLRPEADGQSYVFKHELIREVAYRSLLVETRRVMHAKAVEFIETRYAERLEEHIDRLADHAFEAQLWAKAVPYQMRSARRALRRGANHEAIAICERAQAALERVPESADRTKAEIDFTLAGIIALEPVGRHQRIANLLTQARDKAKALGDPWRVAAVNCQLVVALWRVGQHKAAMAAAASAEEVARKLGDASLIFAARHNTGIVHHELGNFAAAIAAFRGCLALETPEIDAKRVGWAALPSVVLRTFLADSLFEAGELDDAARVGEEGIARAELAGHAYSRVQINQVRSRIMLAQGQTAEALEMLAADWRTSVELDMVQMHPIIATRLGEAHLAAGDVAAALEVLAQPERLDVPLTENAFGWRYLFLARGHAYLSGGRSEDALSCARRALALAMEREERPQAAYAHELLGRIARERDRNGRLARAHFREAARLAEACGMRLLASRCRTAAGGKAGLVQWQRNLLHQWAARAWLALPWANPGSDSARMALRPGRKK